MRFWENRKRKSRLDYLLNLRALRDSILDSCHTSRKQFLLEKLLDMAGGFSSIHINGGGWKRYSGHIELKNGYTIDVYQKFWRHDLLDALAIEVYRYILKTRT